MSSYSTLRTHTLVLLISLFFSFSLTGATIVSFAGASITSPCVGNTINFTVLMATPNVTATVTDNDMTDGVVIATQFCLACTPPSGSGAFFFSVNIGAAGTVIGSTVTFTVTLIDPTGISEFPSTGIGTQVNPNRLDLNFSFVVDDTPIAAITPSSLELCDNATANLTAVVTNGASADDYTWSADGGNGSFSGGNPGDSPVAVAQGADTYRVTITNQCTGEGNSSATITNNLTPSIQMDCSHNGNGTTDITADILNAATGVNVQFFNDGNLHTTSNNNNGPGDDPTINVNDIAFHQQVFTATASNSCGNASISGSCLVLPVELLYFRAEPLDNNTLLQWATATELNNDFFTVERSFDNKTFAPIGIVEGAGSSQELLTYEYVDKEVTSVTTSSNIYYRLKQTDFDGQFTYSEIIALEVDPKHTFDILHQNFQEESLKVVIYNPGSDPLDVRLYDLNGRLIRQVNLLASQGKTELSLSVPNLKAGFYIITASNGQQTLSKKVAKVE